MTRSLLLTRIVAIPVESCGAPRRFTLPKDIPSPNGRRVLRAEVNREKTGRNAFLCVRFVILNRSGQVEFEWQADGSDARKWSMSWDGDDRVVLRSSDVGDSSGVLGPNGRGKPGSRAGDSPR